MTIPLAWSHRELVMIACSLTALLFCMPSEAANVSFESGNKQIALLELYTSEGCSSCPPADRWLTSLQKHEGLWQEFVPIAFHVDYWDYIGWKDRFASPAYGARQRRYADEQSLKTVYTPGFILNGREWRRWFSKKRLAIAETKMPGMLKLEIAGEDAKVEFIPRGPAPGQLQVNLALLGFDLKTKVRNGENKGRTLTHNFIVLALEKKAMDSNGNRFSAVLGMPITTIKSGRSGIVAWVNTTRKQTPLQTVGGWLPD